MFKTISKKTLSRLIKQKKKKINRKRHNNMRQEDNEKGTFLNAASLNILFLITSVIYPWNTEYNAQRYIDTLETISSIRSICPQANILLIDGGRFFKGLETIKSKVDRFIYVGDNRKIKKFIMNKNKGIGEAFLIRCCYSYIKNYEFVIKVSGRYKLTSNFTIANFDKTALNYKNYYTYKYEERYGLSGYIEGSHSTRLYGVPLKYYKKWMRALIFSLPFMYINLSIEYILPMLMDECRFYYHKKIGVTGDVAGKGEIIEE